MYATNTLRLIRSASMEKVKETKEHDSTENEGRTGPVISRLLYIPSVANEKEVFPKKPEGEGFDMKAVLTAAKTSKSFYKMNNSAFLRDYRKRNKAKQTTMLRYIRSGKCNNSSSAQNSPSTSSNSLRAVRNKLDTTVKEDCTTNSINGVKSEPDTTNGELDTTNGVKVEPDTTDVGTSPDLKYSIKIELDTTIQGAKNSSPVKVEQNAPLLSTPLFQTSEDDIKTEIKDEFGCSSDVQTDNSAEEESFVAGSKYRAKKRCIIDSDDESTPEPKRHHIDTSSSPKKLSPVVVENLIDMYCDLYPGIDKMEMYDYIRELNYDFTALTQKLDYMKKTRLIDRKSIKLHELAKERRLREALRIQEKLKKVADREQQKTRKNMQRLQIKKQWQMKGKTAQDFMEDDEEDFVKATRVYESDSSDEEEDTSDKQADEAKVASRELVLNFYKDASTHEMLAVSRCSKKKCDAIVQCRPFHDWDDLVAKFKNERLISTDLLNSAIELLIMRDVICKLMKRCECIASSIRAAVSSIVDDEDTEINCKITQPAILNNSLSLKSYQVIGLNWLVLMYQQGINGVLADEMGLGKTIQAIAFLAHLKEQNKLDQLCLLVVPSSTLDNWAKELELWCPSLGFLLYHGSQEERRGMRVAVANNELDDNVYIMLTTYSMVTSTSEDRGLFKSISFDVVIFDEAHMLKNMATQRFENLSKIKAKHRLLLTGTPLQNNLVELMSILVFVMPQLFEGKKEMLKKMFSMFPKSDSKDDRSQYEKRRIEQAKRIMMPFFLRRLKEDVLKDLPPKEEHILRVKMSDRQEKVYKETIELVNARAAEIKKEIINSKETDITILTDDPDRKALAKDSSTNILMALRKICNHPLLVRNLYTRDKLENIATILRETTHKESLLAYIIEDFCIMSDFEIHKTCRMYPSISEHCLPNDVILDSGKFKCLDEMLPEMKKKGDRVLIFSQFVIMLDIIEDYMELNSHSYCRLDGRTQVTERQGKIDDFNENEDIFAFLLSTRAGGLGINLSSANKVIIYDIDFNPYNDKQAEDRCHRVGQIRNVSVYRYVTEGTIEEGMRSIAMSKLQLEKDVTEVGESRKADVLHLLESALAAH